MKDVVKWSINILTFLHEPTYSLNIIFNILNTNYPVFQNVFLTFYILTSRVGKTQEETLFNFSLVAHIKNWAPSYLVLSRSLRCVISRITSQYGQQVVISNFLEDVTVGKTISKQFHFTGWACISFAAFKKYSYH